MNPIEYAVVDLSASADTVVTAEECDLIYARVTVVMSAHEVALENGTGGDVVDVFPASSAVAVERDFKGGIRMSSGITVAANASSTGTIVVAYRRTSGV